MNIKCALLGVSLAVAMLFCQPPSCRAGQQPDAPKPQTPDTTTPASPVGPLQTSSAPTAMPGKTPEQSGTASEPLRLTLQDALERARKNATPYLSVLTDAAIAHEDKTQARDALLPSVNYNTSAIYTKSGGINNPNPVVFIANNAVHEYSSQANVHEALDFAGVSNYLRLSAAAAVARAKAAVAARGLVVTVVQNYYNVAAAQQKFIVAQKAADEGDGFLKLTQQLEHGGEVAHSDVIKAELQMNERHRQLREAQLALLNARLDLAVLIFTDFNSNFEIADDLHAVFPLPPMSEIQVQALHDNPDLLAAQASLRETGHGVWAARSGYFPGLTLDYFYGIDSTRFALNTVVNNQKFSNLGSSATATLSIPIWNWGATQSRIKQAQLRRTQAKHELSYAQRKLLAEIQSIYSEAETALNELGELSRSAELAADSLRLVTLRYKDGESTVLEVVDAQTTFAQANMTYQDAAVRYRVALANLQTLTGVLTTP